MMLHGLNKFTSRLDGEDPRLKQQPGLRNKTLQLVVEPCFDLIVGINP